jgi:hypothetical protein
VLDARGRPSSLSDGEHFVAHVETSDFVLVLSSDANGDPIYRATLPTMFHDTDVDLRLGQADDPRDEPVATMRVTVPFTLRSAPKELRVGDELRVELATTAQAPDGLARIRFDGACMPPMLPTELTTAGGVSEVHFDTTYLGVTGGCDVIATIMFVHEEGVSSGAFDGSRSPLSQGIQQRALVVHLTQ